MKSEHFYKVQFGYWYDFLKPIVYTERFDKLLSDFSGIYNIETTVPTKKYVFSAFRACPLNKLKLIILAEKPVITDDSNGLALSDNIESFPLDYQTEQIIKAWEEDYFDGLLMNPRVDMEHIANQGVLLLNASLTTDKYQGEKHEKLWEPFTKAVLKRILTNYNVPVVLWGRKVHKYSALIEDIGAKYINVIEPVKGTEWKFSFKEIDKLLTKNLFWQ